MYLMTKAVLMILLFFSTALTAVAGDILNEGLWEISSKMEVPGMPMEMPPVIFKQCLTSKDNIPQNRNEIQNCTIIKSNTKGSTVTWEMHCANDGQTMVSNGRTTYSGDTFKGEIRTAMKGMNMMQKMSGRRIGSCK